MFTCKCCESTRLTSEEMNTEGEYQDFPRDWCIDCCENHFVCPESGKFVHNDEGVYDCYGHDKYHPDHVGDVNDDLRSETIHERDLRRWYRSAVL